MMDDTAPTPSSAPIEPASTDVQAPTPAAGVDWGDAARRQAEAEGRKPDGSKDAKPKKDGKFRERDDDPSSAKRARELDDILQRADDKVTKRHADKGKAKPKSESVRSRHFGEDTEKLNTIFERADSELKGRVGKPDPKEWKDPEVRKARRELRSMFPNRKLGETWKTLQAWDELLRTRPREEATATVLRELYKYMPQDFPGAKEDKNAGKKDISSAVSRAAQDVEDLNELEEATKQFGKHLPSTLVRMSSILRSLVDDPANGLLRLSYNYEFQREAEAEKAAKQAEREWQKELAKPEMKQRIAQLNSGLETILQRNMLPGLETPEMQEAVANILEAEDFPRSDDPGINLVNAYKIASHRLATARSYQNA